MSIQSLSATQLRQAADLREKIESLNNQLATLLGGSGIPVPSKVASPAKKKGGMSAEGRARISAAAKKRWAKVKAAKLPVKVEVKTVKPVANQRKKMSAAAKAKLSKLAKERWAKAKATGKKKL